MGEALRSKKITQDNPEVAAGRRGGDGDHYCGHSQLTLSGYYCCTAIAMSTYLIFRPVYLLKTRNDRSLNIENLPPISMMIASMKLITTPPRHLRRWLDDRHSIYQENAPSKTYCVEY